MTPSGAGAAVCNCAGAGGAGAPARPGVGAKGVVMRPQGAR